MSRNATESLCVGQRHFEERKQKVVALKRAIQEGIDSGIADDFDSKVYLKKLKSAKANS